MYGCGCGHRHGRRGRGMRGVGRGRCQQIYEETGTGRTGTGPAWSRRAGGPGYWRSRAAGMPEDWDVGPQEGGEVARLRQQVDSLHEKIDVLLERLVAADSPEAP